MGTSKNVREQRKWPWPSPESREVVCCRGVEKNILGLGSRMCSWGEREHVVSHWKLGEMPCRAGESLEADRVQLRACRPCK